MTGVREAVLVARFRRGLLTLAASAAAGTALELAMLRHWNGVDQLVPWATLVMVAAGIAIVAFSGARAAVLTGRAIGCGSAIAGVFGVYEHIASNYEAGPLDFRYADRWATMSMPAAGVGRGIGDGRAVPGARAGDPRTGRRVSAPRHVRPAERSGGCPGDDLPRTGCTGPHQPDIVGRDQRPSAETPHGRVGGQGRLAAEMGVQHA